MIDIDKSSLLYRIALYGVFFEDHRLGKNICPFMRCVGYGIVLLTFYTFFIAGFIGCLIAPWVHLYANIVYDIPFVAQGQPYFVFGVAIYMIAIVVFAAWFCTNTKMGKTFCDKMDHDAVVWLSRPENEKWVVLQWIKAKHDKICLPLRFYGKKEDGYMIKKNK